MYTRRMPEQFLFTKEKGSLFNVKGWMKLLGKKSTPCYGNENRNHNKKEIDYWEVYKFILKKIIETRAGGVISSHCGPGTLGVLFIAK